MAKAKIVKGSSQVVVPVQKTAALRNQLDLESSQIEAAQVEKCEIIVMPLVQKTNGAKDAGYFAILRFEDGRVEFHMSPRMSKAPVDEDNKVCGPREEIPDTDPVVTIFNTPADAITASRERWNERHAKYDESILLDDKLEKIVALRLKQDKKAADALGISLEYYRAKMAEAIAIPS